MSILEVPFYKQETIYTCGPASIRMVLAYFGQDVPEDVLATEMGTNDAMGTERERMAAMISSRKLIPHEHTDSTLADLKALFDAGIPTLVRFFETEHNVDHYGVVVGMDDEKLYFHDPWSGPLREMELGIFAMRWPCQYTHGQTCWLLGVGPERIN